MWFAWRVLAGMGALVFTEYSAHYRDAIFGVRYEAENLLRLIRQRIDPGGWLREQALGFGEQHARIAVTRVHLKRLPEHIARSIPFAAILIDQAEVVVRVRIVRVQFKRS